MDSYLDGVVHLSVCYDSMSSSYHTFAGLVVWFNSPMGMNGNLLRSVRLILPVLFFGLS